MGHVLEVTLQIALDKVIRKITGDPVVTAALI
jgi:hypothetical protein